MVLISQINISQKNIIFKWSKNIFDHILNTNYCNYIILSSFIRKFEKMCGLDFGNGCSGCNEQDLSTDSSVDNVEKSAYFNSASFSANSV